MLGLQQTVNEIKLSVICTDICELMLVPELDVLSTDLTGLQQIDWQQLFFWQCHYHFWQWWSCVLRTLFIFSVCRYLFWTLFNCCNICILCFIYFIFKSEWIITMTFFDNTSYTKKVYAAHNSSLAGKSM